MLIVIRSMDGQSNYGKYLYSNYGNNGNNGNNGNTD